MPGPGIIEGRPLARIDDIARVDMPADERGPRCINCYFVKVEDAAAICADAKKFKIDPLRLLYSLRWQHRAEPPHFELMLIQAEPQGWVHTVNLVLLGALRDRAPEAIDWERLTAAGIVSQLDAFEG